MNKKRCVPGKESSDVERHIFVVEFLLRLLHVLSVDVNSQFLPRSIGLFPAQKCTREGNPIYCILSDRPADWLTG